ncbi:MAG: hypothetical protein ACFFEA_06685, partial [Candidatus Thorarchaeota archaeon]
MVAAEIRLNAALTANPGSYAQLTESNEKLIKTLKRSVKWSGVSSAMMIGMITLLSLLLAASPFIAGDPPILLVFSFTMFMGFAFVLLFVLNLQNTTAYFSSKSIELISTLPLLPAEFDGLCTLAFLRIFFAPVLAILVLFPVGTLLLFGPIIACISFLSCVITVLFSIGVLVKSSKWFHHKITSAPQSKWGTAIRIITSLGLIVGIFAAIGMMSYMPALILFITQEVAGINSPLFAVLAWIFPFSFSLLGASIRYGASIPFLTTAFAAVGVIVYSLIALYSFRWSGRALHEISFGGAPVDEKPSESIEFRPTGPLTGIIRKDMRLGSRSMSAIMIFAIPLLMAIFVYPFLTMSPEGVIRSTNILIGLGYAQTFLGFSVIGLLSVDAQGASVFDGLPLRPFLNLQAKVIIFLVCEVLAMSVIALLLATNPIIVPLLIVMPICQIPCGYAFAMTIGAVIYLRKGGGSVVALNLASEQGLVILSVAVGAVFGILPLIGYAVALLSMGLHQIGLGVQLAVSIL